MCVCVCTYSFDHHWAEVGASSNPCSQIYTGPYAHSEPEVAALAAAVEAHGNVHFFVDVHSYSQMWLAPWGWTNDLPPHYSEHVALTSAAVGALQAVHGTVYTSGPSGVTIYPTSGTTDDYMYGTLGITHSYAIETRDRGQYGFLLPAAQIKPNAQEVLAAFIASAIHILGPALSPGPPPPPPLCPPYDVSASCVLGDEQLGRRCTCRALWSHVCSWPVGAVLSCDE